MLLLAGATGRLGTNIATQWLASGGRVAAAVRRPWQVAKVHDALGRDRVLVGVVPPEDTEAAAGFVKGAQDALGPIECFVGAAGAWQAAVRGREPGGDAGELLTANLLANANLARAVLPFLRRRKRGTLAFLGAADDALAAASAACAASKAALHAFVAALARDLADTGVRAFAVLLPLATSVPAGTSGASPDRSPDGAGAARVAGHVLALVRDAVASRAPLVPLPA